MSSPTSVTLAHVDPQFQSETRLTAPSTRINESTQVNVRATFFFCTSSVASRPHLSENNPIFTSYDSEHGRGGMPLVSRHTLSFVDRLVHILGVANLVR